MKREIKIVVNVVKWFDKINGNTYHSCRIIRCADGAQLACELQYGYGEQYKQTALAAMVDAGWIQGYTIDDVYGKYERENNYPILWNVSDGKKRDCVDNGKI